MQKSKQDQPLKSILKQSRPTDEHYLRNLEREVKYWKSRFDDLTQKRQKQTHGIQRGSIWDIQQDEQKEIEIFQKIEQQILAGQNIEQQQEHLIGVKMDDQKENSMLKFEITSLSNLQMHSENDLFQVKDGSPQAVQKTQSAQEIQQSNWVELNQQLSNLIKERDLWKSKYEESIHPRNIQKIQEEMLQDFLFKAQSGIQEAAEQFDAEKRAYINSKVQEVNKLQEKILEYASMVSDKDSLLLQKEIQISEVELTVREKESQILKLKEELKFQNEQIANLRQDNENQIKYKQDSFQIEQKLMEEIEKITQEKTDLENENKSQNQTITELRQKIDQLKEKCDEFKDKISKLKSQNEEQEELNEQLEEYRSTTCTLTQENESLKNEINQLQNKLKNYEKMIQQKGIEVQTMILSLQEEMKNYANEVQLLQQAETKQNEKIKDLETQLLREKQLTLILQDTILNKSLIQQSQRQQCKQLNESDNFPQKINDRIECLKTPEKSLFKDNTNLLYSSNKSRLEDHSKEAHSSLYLSVNNENQN
ncbi:hypothetical protein TTHERM_00241850 (macronuclear) [Tetrahymena thermophila SB210]|uniref:Uncharacterized protein n=1 Tax=Tetrahymena thermophila (strain SB210) TaxID=312017 RepID=I7M406_TETTS|nr:hypothetical protein TTHERM_00241850 [Tetrahymena thermophila SB210]EAS04664.2 hypothetical protein TTHERM_00241850 [Tetrahymena thermophila SB210]|eukprot:XP_001024909.2 hypothetical protein TTHERM_00241850 [Tetrahymena thermophila SB210]